MESLLSFKMLVLGPQGVGKSSLIMRYLKGEFSQSYNVTVGVQFASKIVQIDSQTQVRLQIWDTAGQEFYQALVRSFYQGISAVFLVYAIDKAQTLKDLKKWVSQVRQNSHQEVVMFLIGSKLDCQQNRQVDQQAAASFLKQISGAFLVETSSKTGENIELLFKKAADIMFKKYNGNKIYRELVRPQRQSNLTDAIQRNRATSIVLRNDNISNSRRETKQKCCK